MSKEFEQTKPLNPQNDGDFVPFKLPSVITPFNIGEVMYIQSMNEKHRQKTKSKPRDKK